MKSIKNFDDCYQVFLWNQIPDSRLALLQFIYPSSISITYTSSTYYSISQYQPQTPHYFSLKIFNFYIISKVLAIKQSLCQHLNQPAMQQNYIFILTLTCIKPASKLQLVCNLPFSSGIVIAALSNSRSLFRITGNCANLNYYGIPGSSMRLRTF